MKFEDILDQPGLVGMILRLTVILTAPIWILAIVTLYFLALVFIAGPYWLWTGKDLTT